VVIQTSARAKKESPVEIYTPIRQAHFGSFYLRMGAVGE
jgi:hypothetical protein